MTNLLRRCYGVVRPGSGFFTASIDGSTPQIVSGENSVELVQKLLWSSTALSAGRHTLTITTDGTRTHLDFFR